MRFLRDLSEKNLSHSAVVPLLRRAAWWGGGVIAGALLTALIFATYDRAQEMVLGIDRVALVTQLDDLETDERKIGGFLPVNLDGFGTPAGVVLLVARASWWDNPTHQIPVPEIVVVEWSREGQLVEVYRFQPTYLTPTDVAERARSLIPSTSIFVEDIDGDGRQEILTAWETIGANRYFMFVTVTEVAGGQFRTVDLLPAAYAVERDGAWRYVELSIRNAHDNREPFLVHGVDEFFPVPGRVVTGIRTEIVCGACSETWEVAVIENTDQGFAYSPRVVSKQFVRTPDTWIPSPGGGRMIDRSVYYQLVSDLSREEHP